MFGTNKTSNNCSKLVSNAILFCSSAVYLSSERIRSSFVRLIFRLLVDYVQELRILIVIERMKQQHFCPYHDEALQIFVSSVLFLVEATFSHRKIMTLSGTDGLFQSVKFRAFVNQVEIQEQREQLVTVKNTSLLVNEQLNKSTSYQLYTGLFIFDTHIDI